jgi:hypothetical protein
MVHISFWKNVRTKRTMRTKCPFIRISARGESVRHKRPMRHKSPAAGRGRVMWWVSVVKELPILEVRTGRSSAHCAIVCSLRGLVGGRRKTG